MQVHGPQRMVDENHSESVGEHTIPMNPKNSYNQNSYIVGQS